MRVAFTGKDGQLGRSLAEVCGAADDLEPVAAYGRADLDVADRDAVAALFEGGSAPPDVLVNAAAYTAVDQCESDEETAREVNGGGPGRLAEVCATAGVRLVHVSTDYVFDGGASEPLREEAPTGPKSAYGRTKLLGEERVLAAAPESLVVRTSWVYGPGHNFVKAILRQARLRRSGEVDGPLKVVDDQRGCPTYARDLAEGLIGLAQRAMRGGGEGEAPRGLYHLSNAGPTTWWGFARQILDECGCSDLEIDRGRTEDLKLAAPRPAYSVLDTSRAAQQGVTLRSWHDALRAYLETQDAQMAREGL